MSILIKGMEMPLEKPLVIQIYPEGTVRRLDGSIYNSHFEAVPVPPHGDLIDYDFCMENYELLHDDDGNPVYAVRMRDINNAPAIIPAEDED